MPSSTKACARGFASMAKGLVSGAAAAGRVTAIRLKIAMSQAARIAFAAGRGIPIVCRSRCLNGVVVPRPALLPLRSRWPFQLRRNSPRKRHFYLPSCVSPLRTQHNIPRLLAIHFDGQCELDAAEHLLRIGNPERYGEPQIV